MRSFPSSGIRDSMIRLLRRSALLMFFTSAFASLLIWLLYELRQLSSQNFLSRRPLSSSPQYRQYRASGFFIRSKLNKPRFFCQRIKFVPPVYDGGFEVRRFHEFVARAIEPGSAGVS